MLRSTASNSCKEEESKMMNLASSAACLELGGLKDVSGLRFKDTALCFTSLWFSSSRRTTLFSSSFV